MNAMDQLSQHIVSLNFMGSVASEIVLDLSIYYFLWLLWFLISLVTSYTGKGIRDGSLLVLSISLVHCIKAWAFCLMSRVILICPCNCVREVYCLISWFASSIVLSKHIVNEPLKISLIKLCAGVNPWNRDSLSIPQSTMSSLTVNLLIPFKVGITSFPAIFLQMIINIISLSVHSLCFFIYISAMLCTIPFIILSIGCKYIFEPIFYFLFVSFQYPVLRSRITIQTLVLLGFIWLCFPLFVPF